MTDLEKFSIGTFKDNVLKQDSSKETIFNICIIGRHPLAISHFEEISKLTMTVPVEQFP